MKLLGLYTFISLTLIGIVACDYKTQNATQTRQSVDSIVRNQPLPNLGGFSFEREMVRSTMVARNRDVVATYTYMILETVQGGQIIEVCSSLGYPIPYAVQLTSPDLPEANGLYYPDSAEASWVSCVNSDGTVTPAYFEPRVIALPYRIKADRVLERVSEPKYRVDPTKASP